MIIHHHGLAVPLEEAWWQEAGMKTFLTSSKAYFIDKSNVQGQRICLVAIDDVGPVNRLPGVPIFNKSSEEGISAAERVIRILRGFLNGAAIPPIELVRTLSGPHAYKLTNGVHRFYCSLAAGFTHVPAIKGFDRETLDHPEMRNDQDLC